MGTSRWDHRRTLTAALLSLSASALGAEPAAPADLIVVAGRIWTGDPARPWAEAIAARSGAVAALGTRDEVLRLRGPATRIIEAADGLATPGLVDAHGHIASLGRSLEDLDLRGATSPEEVGRRVKQRADALPADAWITGSGWDQGLWPDGAFPTSAVLDAVAPNRSVWLTRIDGHAGWANGEAMRRAGVDETTRPPSGGLVHHDPTGAPSGVFIDAAMGLIGRAVPPPSPADLERRILAAQDRIIAQGLTGVHDAGVSKTEAEVFRALDRSGRLRLRVYAMALPTAGEEVQSVSRPPSSPREGGRFEMRAVKLFMDGALGSRGALLFEPYHDDPGNSGLSLIEPQVLEATTVAALRNGWQVATHAIGDRANAMVLDAYAAALETAPPPVPPRLRIEHAQVVRKQDVDRFARLGVIASMQPSHASSDLRWADARLGLERAKGAYAWRWFLDAEVPLAFGSDFPVEVVNPCWGLYAAITRQDAEGRPKGGWRPDQRLTLEEALRAFTAGAAYAAFVEDRRGVLRPGMRADITIFDRDLFHEPPARVLSSRVTNTIIDGSVEFDARRP
jgi:predicted amidohydrolase YtcJ